METSSPEYGWEDAHSPLPASASDETVLLPHDLHQIHGLLQSEDVGTACFFPGHAKRFLTHGPFVEGWFELWDLYDKWTTITSKANAALMLSAIHEEKNAEGKSVHAVRCGQRGFVAHPPFGNVPPNRQRWEVIFPDGHIEVRDGLTKLCEEYGLRPSNLSKVARGERKQHLGFKVKLLTQT